MKKELKRKEKRGKTNSIIYRFEIGVWFDGRNGRDEREESKGILMEALRQRMVRKGLIERVEEMLWETKSRVRVGRELWENFWTAREIRQEYPLSPLLFNILMAKPGGKDKEGGGGEEYRKEKREYKKLCEIKKKRRMTGGKEKSKE